MTFEGAVGHGGAGQLAQGFVRRPEDGQSIDLPGWSMLVKVTACDTLGRLTVIEGRMAPQLAGPPAHVHDGHDETFVILEGRMRFRVDDGSNPFDEPARYIAILTPSGYEDYFAKVAEHVDRSGTMPDPDQTRVLMAQRHTVLAPFLVDRGS